MEAMAEKRGDFGSRRPTQADMDAQVFAEERADIIQFDGGPPRVPTEAHSFASGVV